MRGKFNIELFDSICEEIATTDKGLSTICKAKDVSTTAFYNWINDDDSLVDKYARARELQAEYLADQIIQLSNEELISEETTIFDDGQGNEKTSTTRRDNFNRTRLQIDARKWKASKLAPKKFGERVDVTSLGEKIGTLPPFMKTNESQS